MQKEQLILAIDGGASSSKAGVISINTKKILREYIGNPVYNDKDNIKGILLNLKEILIDVRRTFRNLEGIIIGVSGIDTEEEKLKFSKTIKRLVKIYFKCEKVLIVNDIELLTKNKLQKYIPNIVLISGSGVNCVLVEGSDIIAKSGGLGQILADQGGGFYIGKCAIEASVKSWDGRGEKTMLEKEILTHLKIKNFFELKNLVSNSDFAKKDYADIAKVVVKCFEKTDNVSKKILQIASEELFLHVVAVAKKNKINEFNLLLCGNIMKIALIQENLKEYTKKYFKNSSVKLLSQKTFYGGVNYFD